MNQPLAEAVFDFPGRPLRRFARAREVLRAQSLAEVTPVIAAAARAAHAGHVVAGFVTYEAAPAFDRAMVVRGPARMPLAWFAIFDDVDPPRAAHGFTPPRFSISHTVRDFAEKVDRIRSEIAAGRTYQANLTTRFNGTFSGDALGLFESLRPAQGAGYHAYIDTGDFQIVSVSPELFFETHGRRIRTRPMKGTRARGRWEAEDEIQAVDLRTSEKDRAENLMIVDLLRNDLGRIGRIGSVEVSSLFDVERYHTVHQMTSTIEAELREDAELPDIFRALFPCGSVTGAPKISTMQLIAELEEQPREIYCGALGLIEPGGNAIFNVPIRTVWIERDTHCAVYGSGAGITFDSDALAEYAEVESKASVLVEPWPAFELLETMRAEHGTIHLADRHCARIMSSARYFGIPAHEKSVQDALACLAASATEPRMIRLLIDQHGRVRSEEKAIADIRNPRVALARQSVSSHNRFLFHKTTHRSVYETVLAQRPECWDVLLWNERSEITEFTRGNVVLEIAGKLITPPLESGLLAGTFRAQLLETGIIREGTLRIEDLKHAHKIWLINSVREWLEVDLKT